MTSFEEIQNAVCDHKPVLKKNIENHGQKTLFEYWKNNFKQPIAFFSDRQRELASSVTDIVRERLGEGAAKCAADYLEKNSFVSTADHHHLLCHPFFSNEILVQSLVNQHAGLNTILVFGCAGISLDNSSFPRGLFYHDSSGEEIRLPFFSLASRHVPVYSLPGYKKKSFSDPSVQIMLDEVYFTEKIISREKYRDQATIANFNAWKKIPGQEKTNLLYIDQESIVVRLLVTHLLSKDTLIREMLTTREGLDAFGKHFKDIIGSFSYTTEKGAFLFWALVNGKRERLIRKGDHLENKSGTYSLGLTSENIIRELKNETIFPTMALTLSVLSFYYGLTLGGGFSQVDYLSEMREAYIRLFSDLKHGSEIRSVEQIETDHFSGDIILATIGKERKKATLLDLMLYSKKSVMRSIEARAKKITLARAMSYLMPEYHKILYGSWPDMKVPHAYPKPVIDYKTPLKKKCPYCGNSQVNHTLVRLNLVLSMQSSSMHRRLMKSRLGKLAWYFVTKVEFPIFKFFRLIGLAEFVEGDAVKPVGERSGLIYREAVRRGIHLKQVFLRGQPSEYFFGRVYGRFAFFESLPRPKHLETDSVFWLDDKSVLKKKLRENNIAVPKGGSFSDVREIKNVFNEIEKPVIVKPRFGSRGRHTTTHVYTWEQLRHAVRVAKQLSPSVIVEEHLEGSVYRATMIGGKFYGMLRGDPPRVTGNGESTLEELITEKNKTSHEKVKPVVMVQKNIDFIARIGITLETILPKGQTIDLTEKVGASYGGYTAEMSPVTHPKLITILERAAEIINDPVIGFDLITTDVSADPDTVRWGIIEANSLPFINLHYEPIEGPSLDLSGKIWDLWELKK